MQVAAEDFHLSDELVLFVRNAAFRVAVSIAKMAAADATAFSRRASHVHQRAQIAYQKSVSKTADPVKVDQEIQKEAMGTEERRLKAVGERQVFMEQIGEAGFERQWRPSYELSALALGSDIDAALVGKIVRIFWAGEGQYYEALVLQRLDSGCRQETHLVVYLVDGIVQREDLRPSTTTVPVTRRDRDWDVLMIPPHPCTGSVVKKRKITGTLGQHTIMRGTAHSTTAATLRPHAKKMRVECGNGMGRGHHGSYKWREARLQGILYPAPKTFARMLLQKASSEAGWI
jgi:hypothetical protein